MNPIHKIPSFCFESPWLRTLDLNLSSTTVVAGTRTIRATWTPELAQNLQTFNNIYAEAELTALLSQQIALEIDMEILNTFNTTHQDLVTVQPLTIPRGRLFYFDFQYGDIEEPNVYGDGSWSLGNTFVASIGFKLEIRPFKFI